MKIPDRKNANIQSQELKRQQISEGIDLAKKVDALRGNLNSLQEQHKRFVEVSGEELKRETTELFGQKETLKAEVESLNAVKIELQKPLDEAWKKVRDRDTDTRIQEEKLLAREYELEVKETTLSANQKRVDKALEKAEVALSGAEKKNEEAEVAKAESEEVLKKARNKQEKTDADIVQRLAEVERKEKTLEFEHQGVEQVRKLNDVKEQDLDERERKIAAKYKMLLKVENVKRK